MVREEGVQELILEGGPERGGTGERDGRVCRRSTFDRGAACIRRCEPRNVKRFRGGLVFEAHRLLYHSTLGLRVIKKKQASMLLPNLTGVPSELAFMTINP